MADELSAPLVRRRDRAAAKRNQALPGARRELPIARIALVAIAVVVVGVGLRLVLVDDPGGGRPAADVAINSTHNANPIAGQVAPAPQPADGAISAGPETSTPVAGGPSFTTLGDDEPAGDASAASAGNAGTPDPSGIIAALAEKTDNGPVPRIGPDGTTPFAAYARTPPQIDGRPMIAVVVTGLGLNEAGTLDAVGKLPPDVTLS
jgi:hypothetical protein